MTVADFKKKIEKVIATIEKENIPLIMAVKSVNALRMKRIFEDGLNSAGSKIGSYSKKTMLATKDQFIKESVFKISKAASGVSFTQNIKTKKATTRKAKSLDKELWIKFPKASKAVPVMIIEGGYGEFREIQGREGDFVNLRYSNDLQSDLSNSILTKSSNSIGEINPIQVDKDTYKTTLKRPINIKKKEWLEDKYGVIFKHTEEENKKFHEVAAFEQRKIIANLLK